MLARVALDTRPGPSARGGELARLRAGADLLERAVELTATDLGVTLAPVGAEQAPPVAVVAPAVVEEDPGEPLPEPDPAAERLALLDAELGETRAAEIAPRFDARRHVRFTSAWASARWDLVTAYHDALAGRLGCAELGAEIDRLAAHAPDIAGDRGLPRRRAPRNERLPGRRRDAVAHRRAPRRAAEPDLVRAAAARRPPDASRSRPTACPIVERHRRRLAPARPHPRPRLRRPRRARHGARRRRPALVAALGASLKTSPDLRGEIALVTGASPGSIAAELVRRLLRGGARVVVTTSTDTPARRRFYRDLYRTSAGPDAELHVVPANLASFGDIDALVEWLRVPGGGRQGRDDLRMDPLTPTLLAPFAALPTTGDASEAGPGLRDRAAPPVARRAAADRRARPAHRAAPALAQPRQLRRRRALRRDQGRARGHAPPRPQRGLGRATRS